MCTDPVREWENHNKGTSINDVVQFFLKMRILKWEFAPFTWIWNHIKPGTVKVKTLLAMSNDKGFRGGDYKLFRHDEQKCKQIAHCLIV